MRVLTMPLEVCIGRELIPFMYRQPIELRLLGFVAIANWSSIACFCASKAWNTLSKQICRKPEREEPQPELQPKPQL